MKTKLLIFALGVFVLISCSKDDELVLNQAPKAFTVTVTVDGNSATLNWTAAVDPEGETIKYNVILDGNHVASNLTTTSYKTENLTYEAAYSGKVEAVDPEGLSTSSNFNFNIASRPNTAPTAAVLSGPAANEQSVSVRATLTWQAATDAEGDAIVYDIYLDGSADPATKIAENLSETSYELTNNLTSNTTFYWKVIARDDFNAESTSKIRSFSTGDLVKGEEVLKNAPFDPRYTTATTFNNRIWVIGGQSGGAIFKDLWSSEDGINWTEEVSELPFGSTARNAFVSFNNKLWVIGGSSSPYDNGSKSEIWSSENGLDWKLESDNAPFGKRTNLHLNKVVVYENALWLFGGTQYNNDNTTSNPRDVWKSTDGINWELISDEDPGFEFVNSNFLVFQDKIWKVGGYHDKKIYSTSDGVNWTLENDDVAFGYRFGYNTTVWDNKIWLVSGSNPQTNIYAEFPDVWYTENGKDWFLATDEFITISGPALTVHNDKVWVIAGGNGFGNPGEYNHVYTINY